MSTQYLSLPPRGEYARPQAGWEGGFPEATGAAPLPPPSLSSAQGPSPLQGDRLGRAL